jgi:hypothetical protein
MFRWRLGGRGVVARTVNLYGAMRRSNWDFWEARWLESTRVVSDAAVKGGIWGEKCVSKPEISRRVSGTSQHCGEVGEEGNKVG